MTRSSCACWCRGPFKIVHEKEGPKGIWNESSYQQLWYFGKRRRIMVELWRDLKIKTPPYESPPPFGNSVTRRTVPTRTILAGFCEHVEPVCQKICVDLWWGIFFWWVESNIFTPISDIERFSQDSINNSYHLIIIQPDFVLANKSQTCIKMKFSAISAW